MVIQPPLKTRIGLTIENIKGNSIPEHLQRTNTYNFLYEPKGKQEKLVRPSTICVKSKDRIKRNAI